MRRSAGFKYMTPSQVNIPSTHKLTILHLQPELITAFFLRHTSARGERVHGSLIPPPSLWPGRELRKYHCSCPPSSPNQVQLGIFSRIYRSSRCRVSWRSAGQAIADSDVLLIAQDFLMTGYSVFKEQEKTESRSSLSGNPLRTCPLRG